MRSWKDFPAAKKFLRKNSQTSSLVALHVNKSANSQAEPPDSNNVELISREIFSSLATINVYGVSIIQQCRMLESLLVTNILAMCLNEPGEASSIAAEQKSNLISRDFELLLEYLRSHQISNLVTEFAQTTSWCRVWDIALDRGVKGTRSLQTPLRELR